MADNSNHIRKSINFKEQPDDSEVGPKDLAVDGSDSDRLVYNRGTGPQRVLLEEDAITGGFTIAANVDYDNATSGLAAEDVQEAIDELVVDLQDEEDRAVAVELDLQGQITNAQNAADAAQTDIDDHIADTVGAHAATAISFAPAGGIAATEVQAAIEELDTEKLPKANPAFTGTLTGPDIDITGSLNVDLTVTTSALDVTTTADIGGNLGVDGITTTDILLVDETSDMVGDVHMYEDLRVDGNSLLQALTVNGALTSSGAFRHSAATDAATTGANQAVAPAATVVALTNASLTSVASVSSPANGKVQVLINKTGASIGVINEYTSATAANRIVTGTGADITLANDASVLMLYNPQDSRWHIVGGTGSGTGTDADEYITNGKAETSTAGWATYADAAGDAPVDGTGGSPNVTFTRTSLIPISGTYSFVMSKDAANRQGQGWSTDFTIDGAALAKVMQVEFDFLPSANFVAGTRSTDSDVTVWVYDVTNGGAPIQLSTYKLYSGSTTIPAKFVGNFQTASNSTSYRLIFHVSTTNANAWDLVVDNVSVKRCKYVYGSPITDLQVVSGTSVTALTGATTTPPTFGTNTVNRVLEKKIGDSAQYRYEYKYTSAGTTGTGDYLFSLPPGRSFDSNKVTYYTTVEGAGNWNGNGCSFGSASMSFQAAAEGLGVIVPYDATRFRVAVIQTSGSVTAGTFIGDSGFAPVGTSGYWAFDFIAPIAGWSSSVQMSSENDGRLVSFYGANGGGTAYTSLVTNIPFTASKDTHGAWNGTEFTVPVPGDYSALFTFICSPASYFPTAYLNGTLYQYGTLQPSAAKSSSGAIYFPNLKVGDKISMRVGTSGTTIASSTLGIVKSGGGAPTIAATESVGFTAYKNSGTHPNNSATAVSGWAGVYKDTHGMFNTTTGVVTFPAPGWYTLSGGVLFSAGLSGLYGNLFIRTESGANFQIHNWLSNSPTAGTGVQGSTSVYIPRSGYTAVLSVYQNSGGVGTFGTATNHNWFSCIRNSGT